jgi:hypothetical protein
MSNGSATTSAKDIVASINICIGVQPEFAGGWIENTLFVPTESIRSLLKTNKFPENQLFGNFVLGWRKQASALPVHIR